MKRLEIVLINRSCAEFKGWRARELYQELAGRPPIRNARTSRWVTTPNRSRDLAALAELKGYDVTVADGRVEVADPGGGRW